jgi:hypothetical protein
VLFFLALVIKKGEDNVVNSIGINPFWFGPFTADFLSIFLSDRIVFNIRTKLLPDAVSIILAIAVPVDGRLSNRMKVPPSALSFLYVRSSLALAKAGSVMVNVRSSLLFFFSSPSRRWPFAKNTSTHLVLKKYTSTYSEFSLHGIKVISGWFCPMVLLEALR